GRRAADERLEKQSVVLTVPASFDDVARNLTVEAAKKAGLGDVTLLEEPQAAFYAWLATAAPVEIERLKPGMQSLVVDVGGGTSDFSLIEAVEERGVVACARRAAGEPRRWGGDTRARARAGAVEARLGTGGRDAAQSGQLVQACRQAKEALLAPDPPASVPVTVMGRGRLVVGGTLTAPLTPAEGRRTPFRGLFPPPPAARPAPPARRAGAHDSG